MGKLRSERERKLQKKLIPLNIVVCIISLVAAISLFLFPILKIDAGKILRDEGLMTTVEKTIDEQIDKSLSGSEQEGVNYKPVVTMLVKSILGKAEGEISVSAYSSFRVLIGSGNKAEMVIDELITGENALATRLIESIVDGVSEMFTTDEGKALLEEAVVATMTKEIISNVDDDTITDALTTENVKELVDILRDLSNPDKVTDGRVDEVAGVFIDKIDSMLGDSINIDEEDRQSLTDQIQEIYDSTVQHLGEDESISMEAIICVTLSQNVDLSKINIEDMLDNVFAKNESEGSVHIHTVDEEVSGGTDDVTGDTEDGTEGGTVDETEGDETGERVIVTNYDDLLIQIGYDQEKKEDIKQRMRTSLNDMLSNLMSEQGIDTYLEYYEYLFFGMLSFIAPWLILFLFSFFHMLAKNKRFMMWYVKLVCWIPPLIWLVLKLFPVVAPKVSFLNEMVTGENSAVVNAVLSSISTYTWISGICYLLLWFVSIFWAFPIKHKIRKERKYPEVEDAADGYEEY